MINTSSPITVRRASSCIRIGEEDEGAKHDCVTRLDRSPSCRRFYRAPPYNEQRGLLMERAMTTLDYIALAALIAVLVFAVVIGSQMSKSKR